MYSFVGEFFESLFNLDYADLRNFADLCEDIGYSSQKAANIIANYIKDDSIHFTDNDVDIKLTGYVLHHVYNEARSEIEDKICVDLEDSAEYYSESGDYGLNVVDEDKAKDILNRVKEVSEKDLSKETKFVLKQLKENI
jgi:hypothetical protein